MISSNKNDPNLFQRLWNLRRLSFPLLTQKLSWIIRERISDYFFDRFVAGRSFVSVTKPKFEHLDIGSSSPTSTLTLKKMFRLFRIQPDDVLADVGCGKGRVIEWWLRQGYKNRIYGFELDNEVASFAKKTFEKHDQITIKNENIIDMFPDDVTVFYIYNSFGEKMMNEFKTRLIAAYYGKSPPAVIYNHCLQIEVFRDDPRFDIQEIDFPEWSLHRNYGYPWYAIIRMIALEKMGNSGETQAPD